MRPEDTADIQRQLDEAMKRADELRAKLNPPGTQPARPAQGAGYDQVQARDQQMQQRQASAGAAMGAPQAQPTTQPAAPSAPSLKGQPATVRMAADMGARAQQGQAFVDQSRAGDAARRANIQAELRKRLLQFAMPGASPMQIDMAHRQSRAGYDAYAAQQMRKPDEAY